MTDTRHTPGPWLIADIMIEALADPENSDTYYTPICELDDGWREETNRANARLIAAAPDLLETLRYVLLADAYDGALTMGNAALSPAIRDRIKRAIAKATGEETDA